MRQEHKDEAAALVRRLAEALRDGAPFTYEMLGGLHELAQVVALTLPPRRPA